MANFKVDKTAVIPFTQIYYYFSGLHQVNKIIKLNQWSEKFGCSKFGVGLFNCIKKVEIVL